MKKVGLLTVVMFCLSIPVFAAPPKTIFEVTVEELSPAKDLPKDKGLWMVNVSFTSAPDPATVDKIVRSAMESAVLLNPSREIMATAFLGDEVMNDTQYSGALIYKPEEKRIKKYVFTGVKKPKQPKETQTSK